MRRGKDGQAGERSIESCSSGHPEGSRREGNAGRRFEKDGMQETHATVVVHQVREDRAEATVEARQLVERNCATRPGKVDGSGLAQGIQLSNLGQGHGNAGREVCRRLIHSSAPP